MKTLILALCALLPLAAFAQPSPGLPPTRIIAGSGITVTTNGVNNFTIAGGGGSSVTNYGPNLTNVVVRQDSGNALTVNTNVLIVDTNSVRFGGTSVTVSNNFSAGGGSWNLGANLTLAAGQGIASSGKGLIYYESDGICEFWNNAITGFSALRFGGRGTATPAIWTTGTALEIKTGDGSALTNLAARTIYATNISVTNLTATRGDLAEYLQLGDLGGDPATVANSGFLYGNDVAGTVEVFVMDEAGNITQISPHARRSSPAPASVDAGDKTPVVIHHQNIYTGEEEWLHLSAMARKLEQLTGEKFVFKRKLPANRVRDWDAEQERLRREREALRKLQQAAVAEWTANTNEIKGPRPAVRPAYVPKPKPSFLNH